MIEGFKGFNHDVFRGAFSSFGSCAPPPTRWVERRVLFGGIGRGPAKWRRMALAFVFPQPVVIDHLLLPRGGAGLIVHSIQHEHMGRVEDQLLGACPGAIFDGEHAPSLRVAATRMVVTLQRCPASRTIYVLRQPKGRALHLVRRTVSPGPSRRKPLSCALAGVICEETPKNKENS